MAIRKILIIEHTFEFADLIYRTVGENGFEAKIAPSGLLAFRFLDADWDLIILNPALPDVSARTILRHLARRKPPPPVLVLATSVPQEGKSRGPSHHHGYLGKPFVLGELVGRVQAMLDQTLSPRRDTDVADCVQRMPGTPQAAAELDPYLAFWLRKPHETCGPQDFLEIPAGRNPISELRTCRARRRASHGPCSRRSS